MEFSSCLKSNDRLNAFAGGARVRARGGARNKEQQVEDRNFKSIQVRSQEEYNLIIYKYDARVFAEVFRGEEVFSGEQGIHTSLRVLDSQDHDFAIDDFDKLADSEELVEKKSFSVIYKKGWFMSPGEYVVRVEDAAEN